MSPAGSSNAPEARARTRIDLALPEPHVLAEEIADDLRNALEQIEGVLADLQQRAGFP